MAAAASSSILQPEQQQQGGREEATPLPNIATPEAVPTASAWKSSGSIGPFFAVISVLAILAILSCYLGRMWNRRPLTPLESIENQGCFGWIKLMFRRCIPTHFHVGNLHKPKITTLPAQHNNNHQASTIKDGDVAPDHHQSHSQV